MRSRQMPWLVVLGASSPDQVSPPDRDRLSASRCGRSRRLACRMPGSAPGCCATPPGTRSRACPRAATRPAISTWSGSNRAPARRRMRRPSRRCAPCRDARRRGALAGDRDGGAGPLDGSRRRGRRALPGAVLAGTLAGAAGGGGEGSAGPQGRLASFPIFWFRSPKPGRRPPPAVPGPGTPRFDPSIGHRSRLPPPRHPPWRGRSMGQPRLLPCGRGRGMSARVAAATLRLNSALNFFL
jgi:hypothetical protein